jgi:hypothetical protein
MTSVIDVVKINGEYFRSVASAKICLGDEFNKSDVTFAKLLAIDYFESHDWETRNRKTSYLPLDDTIKLWG